MLSRLPGFVRDKYEIHEWKHASAILYNDFQAEWQDIIDVLSGFVLNKSDVVTGGGNLSPISQSFNNAFALRGWIEKSWATKIVVDQTSRESPTHEVDHYKNRVAVEIEWSNKDPFYDRDLNNFRLLFDLRVISVGVIITKADDLKPVFRGLKLSKFSASTTWMSKLIPRIEGGGGGGCPVLVFGITPRLYDPTK